MTIKFFPKAHGREEDRGFTADEVRRGIPWIYADVNCDNCGKEHPASELNKPCHRCGQELF